LLLTVPLLLAGGIGSLISSSISRLVRDLPQVTEIEAQFGLRGAEAFRPPVVYDRANQVPLFQVLHPLARERRWVAPGAGGLPEHVVQAMLAALDPTFWTNPGYSLGDLGAAILGRPASDAESGPSLTQRLGEAALLPPPRPELGQAARALQSALLAAELTNQYSKEQILTWYLNSAYFGLWTYGVDAAALTYFGKHAAELNLAESAVLAAAARSPEVNPVEAPTEARRQQHQVLERMAELGYISPAQERQAVDSALPVQAEAALQAWDPPGYAAYLLASLEGWLGEGRHRSGLRVISTLDYDLLLQSGCAAATQVERLSRQGAGSVAAAADGSACVAAGLLPPLRPGDAEIDHQVQDWSLVVLDPVSGELLAAHGPLDQRRAAGPMLLPFIYLTALSRGMPAGSMLLDLPPQDSRLQALLGLEFPEQLTDYHGPVLAREALAGLYPGAAAAALQSAGEAQVRRTLQQLGLELPLPDPQRSNYSAESEAPEASLLDLVRAYGILADQGRMEGVLQTMPGGSGPAVVPTILLRVEDGVGRVLAAAQTDEQHVVSAQLAFLLADMLSDESLGTAQASSLEINRPAGILSAGAGGGQLDWTLGFTPQRVVGVWLDASSEEGLTGIEPQNGSASIWHSVMRYAAAGLPPLGWAAPAGVSRVEVCQPSGLLPTPYCSEVVGEYFIQGTEPTEYDTLYQPFRINADTGKLATLFTPLNLVQERVYLVLPPEADAWARQTGIEQPPGEFDPLTPPAGQDPLVQFSSPQEFAVLGGRVVIRGSAAPEEFLYYRLQFGEGLNPGRWVQIGTDERRAQPGGVLGSWDTTGLNGLYTLQLLVVLADGQIRTAALPLTVDNEPPTAELVSPSEGEIVRAGQATAVQLQAAVQDQVGIDRVEFYADGHQIGSVAAAPYGLSWLPTGQPREMELRARAYDVAGNWAESGVVRVMLMP
jgi:membrane peptidoglycan carboxypeptidase